MLANQSQGVREENRYVLGQENKQEMLEVFGKVNIDCQKRHMWQNVNSD